MLIEKLAALSIVIGIALILILVFDKKAKVSRFGLGMIAGGLFTMTIQIIVVSLFSLMEG